MRRLLKFVLAAFELVEFARTRAVAAKMNKAAWKSMPRQLWCLSGEHQNLRTRELKISLGMRDPIPTERPAGRAPGPAVSPQLPNVPLRGQAGSSTEPFQEMQEVDGSSRRYAEAVAGAVVGEAGAVVMGETDATQPRDAAEGAFLRVRAHGGMRWGGGAKESAVAAGTGCCGRGRQESTAPVQWDAVTFPAPAPPVVEAGAVVMGETGGCVSGNCLHMDPGPDRIPTSRAVF